MQRNIMFAYTIVPTQNGPGSFSRRKPGGKYQWDENNHMQRHIQKRGNVKNRLPPKKIVLQKPHADTGNPRKTELDCDQL